LLERFILYKLFFLFIAKNIKKPKHHNQIISYRKSLILKSKSSV